MAYFKKYGRRRRYSNRSRYGRVRRTRFPRRGRSRRVTSKAYLVGRRW